MSSLKPYYLWEYISYAFDVYAPQCVCAAMQQDKHTSNKVLKCSSRFFTGGICDTVKTVLDNKFNNNDYQSENNKIAEIRDKQCKSELAQ